MKKNRISFFLLALCMSMCVFTACSPCKRNTYKEVKDTLITGVAKLANGKYAVYIDFKAYITAGGKNTDFKFGKWWPGVWPGGNAFIPAEQDDCGMYVVLENTENQLRLDIRQGRDTFVDNFTNTFGAYACMGGDETELCFTPSEL